MNHTEPPNQGTAGDPPPRTLWGDAAMGFDLVIRGATVVTPGRREAADIGIADGRIAQLGGTMTGAQELAAGGLLVIPGGVDAHTHLVHRGLGGRLGFPVWVDDFWSGSRAAIAGGITTIGNMTYPVPDEDGTQETPGAAITREMAGATPEAAVRFCVGGVDFGEHGCHLGDGPFRECPNQVEARGEMAIDRATDDAGSGGDVAHSGVGVLSQDIEGDVEDAN